MSATKVSFEGRGYIEISTGPAGLIVHFSPECPNATLIFENKGIPGILGPDIAISTKEIIETEKDTAARAAKKLV